ncbi:MAG: lipoyl(octanoyl) transferase LipB [Thermoanaerobaculia bacterium]|nr:lipoyl(octanoyl) transferase LipB [Thermoanaerobaculia bacterium]MBP9825349.1 lipoyl(octanoyl) transferase LipB [Thermoanaerobaculia bacterium]
MAARQTSWSFLGRVPYAATAALQVELREALRRGEGPERLLLLEHDPVFSLGRNATATDILWSPAELAAHGVEVAPSDRGGQVTFHGPGQLVGYPILDLSPDRRDIRRYVRDLQEVLVRTLADFRIAAAGGEGDRIGVWVGAKKIASIGVHLSRWRTTHGFALNVAPELALFGGIVACGMPEVEMTSIARESGVETPLEEVAARVREHFGAVFERELRSDPELTRRAAGEPA